MRELYHGSNISIDEKQKHARDKQFLIEGISHDVIEMLMDNCHLSLEEAMDTLFNSSTFDKLENEKTGLYYQSPVYIMDMLSTEKPELHF